MTLLSDPFYKIFIGSEIVVVTYRFLSFSFLEAKLRPSATRRAVPATKKRMKVRPAACAALKRSPTWSNLNRTRTH